MYEKILAKVRPGDIIFLHKGLERNSQGFLPAMELTIQRLIDSGYRFARLDSLH
ncbi:MAG: hypothetical protein JXR70_03590 [Spirochaetales bacterium]|nr:hypothetical protein [Spirochaetales bacterium]